MIFLIIEGERYALSLGDTILGGDGDDLLAQSPLASLPPFAVVTSDAERASIRALSTNGPVVLRDRALAQEPAILEHGDCVRVQGIAIYFGDLRNAGRTDHHDGITDEQLVTRDQLPGATPTAATGGAITALSTGRVHEVPETGLAIGRDPDCEIVIASSKVSRRHARVMPGLLGYSLFDDSTNGVLINGARVEKSCLLSQDDLIRIADDLFRFSADAASFEPDARAFTAAPVPLRDAASGEAAARPTEPTAVIPRPPLTARSSHTPTLLATLEVIAGTLAAGTRFRIERPVVQLGRDPKCDIVLPDDSVSGTHATLVQGQRGWRLIDLGSRNGTYVDERPVTECVLAGPCELRVGHVTLVFRPLQSGPPEGVGTLRVVGLTDAQLTKGNRSS